MNYGTILDMPEKDINKQKSPMKSVLENYEVPDNGILKPRLEKIDLLHDKIRQARESNGERWIAALQKLKIRWTTDSNAIEGSRLTYGDTLFFLTEGLTVKGKPFKDFLDARNHADAIDMLFDIVAERRPVTTSFLKEINGIAPVRCQRDTGDGRARPSNNETCASRRIQKRLQTMCFYLMEICIFMWIRSTVMEQVEKLCAWISDQEGKLHPAVVAAIAHYNMVRIHPFDDGNGRGARILMNLILMTAGHIPAVIEDENREDYLEAIRTADKGDIQAFISFVLDAIIKTEQDLLGDLNENSS